MGKPINVEVRVRHGEPVERAIKRFLKKCKKEKVIEDFLERRYYEKPSAKRNKKNIRIKRMNEKNKKIMQEQERRG
jgi:ribosomal protein S21